MTPYSKPLPKINGDNQGFWDGCSAHELRFQQCTQCRHVRWPASRLCPQCHSPATQWVVSKGIGKVHTFCVYHAPLVPDFAADLPYVVAVVVLDEGPRLLTNVIGCRPEAVTCDMPVQVTWENATERVSLPKFKPL